MKIAAHRNGEVASPFLSCVIAEQSRRLALTLRQVTTLFREKGYSTASWVTLGVRTALVVCYSLRNPDDLLFSVSANENHHE